MAGSTPPVANTGWQRAGLRIREARGRLGYKTRADFAQATGLSVSLLADLETGRRGNFDPATLSCVESKLGWAEGSIVRTVEGRRPIRHHDEQLARVIDLWPQLNRQSRTMIVQMIVDTLSRDS